MASNRTCLIYALRALLKCYAIYFTNQAKTLMKVWKALASKSKKTIPKIVGNRMFI